MNHRSVDDWNKKKEETDSKYQEIHIDSKCLPKPDIYKVNN